MDTLPKEIVNEIKYFYKTANFDIIQTSDKDFYFHIKMESIIMKLRMIGRLRFYHRNNRYFYDKNDNIIKEFIMDLSNGKNCYYDEDDFREGNEMFNIDVVGNIIKIYILDCEILLSTECKTQLIEVMKKYQFLLDTYAK